MVTPNLYRNLVANTAAGIAGVTGVMPGGGSKATLNSLTSYFLIFSLCFFFLCFAE
uniref:Uncharacterized protein n=1 Tax=Rhizophora mucronata TaxID=61149 RepID=A0A2P2IRP4_RHIMU